MRCDLRGRVAFVAGGAAGFGQGIAIELARAGAAVAVGDLTRGSAEVVAGALDALGKQAIPVVLDVTVERSVTQAVREVLDHFSRIDILVNSAGSFPLRIGLDLEDGSFTQCVELSGIWRMAMAVVPHFRVQGGGRIVNVASVAGRGGAQCAPGYSAAQAGVISLTQSLARALGVDGINVNAVCHGSMQLSSTQERAGCPVGLQSNPLADSVTPKDVGQAVAFFASDFARNITGQALNVDSGEVMS